MPLPTPPSALWRTRALPTSPAWLAAAVVVLTMGALSACSFTRVVNYKVPGLLGGNVVMRVTVTDELNDLSPVAVDLVVVYDKEVLAMLGKLSAEEWFRGGMRSQFLKDHPQHRADTWHWEWVPGQVVAEQDLAYEHGVKGGVIFADYFFPGDHRAKVDLAKPFLLHLAARGFTVEVLP